MESGNNHHNHHNNGLSRNPSALTQQNAIDQVGMQRIVSSGSKMEDQRSRALSRELSRASHIRNGGNDEYQGVGNGLPQSPDRRSRASRLSSGEHQLNGSPMRRRDTISRESNLEQHN